MGTILLIRIGFSIYGFVGFIYLCHALSRLIFSNEKFLKRLSFFFYAVPLIPIWPLLLFSSGGHKKLSTFINKI